MKSGSLSFLKPSGPVQVCTEIVLLPISGQKFPVLFPMIFVIFWLHLKFLFIPRFLSDNKVIQKTV